MAAEQRGQPRQLPPNRFLDLRVAWPAANLAPIRPAPGWWDSRDARSISR